jgi:hypothetical protein
MSSLQQSASDMDAIARLLFIVKNDFAPAGDMCPACSQEFWEKLVPIEGVVYLAINTCPRCGWIETHLHEKR